MKGVKRLALIDGSLRFALFGLECALGVEFSVREVERVFSDMQTDQVSEKQYQFVDRGKLRVMGHVEEYEPESIWVSVDGGPIEQVWFDGLFERAANQAQRFHDAANRA